MVTAPSTEQHKASADQQNGADSPWHAWTSMLAEHPQLRFWSDHFDDLLLVVDGKGQIGYASPTCKRWLGLEPDMVVGTQLSLHVHPVDQYRLPDHIAELTKDDGHEVLAPIRFENPEGETSWLAGRAVHLTEAGQSIGVLLRFQDASGDPRRLARIRETADRFYKVYRTSPASIAITTLDAPRFTHVNDGFLNLLGFEREEVVGRTVAELGISVEWQSESSIYDQVREEGAVIGVEAQVRTKTGEIRYVFGSYFLIVVSGVRYVVQKVVDITRVRRLEREVLQVSEMERRQLAYDLHDNVGQLLTAAALRLKTLEDMLRKQAQTHEMADRAHQALDVLEQALSATRSLSRQMVPVHSEEGNLREALEEFAQQAEEAYGIECDFHAGDEVELNHPSATAHLCRIVQEAITNAVRHGGARHIDIHLGQEQDVITLRIDDDGSGLPEGTVDEEDEGVGLRSMRYRSRLLGASLRLTNREGEGARVEVTLPLQLLTERDESSADGEDETVEP
ncbi:MAG: PAS domain-containing sensor histidine kinase [Rhodothermales bacterium]